MNENGYLKMCANGKPIIAEIKSLKAVVYRKGETLKLMIEKLQSLDSDYVRVFKKFFEEPGWLCKKDMDFHFKMYFLLHAYVGDELVFLRTGRMVRLNIPNTVQKSFHCAEKMDWFNSDYNCSGKVHLSFCSLEGYDFRLSKFLKPYNNAAKSVPKVIFIH
jgi:hypothetical protein